MSTEQNDSICRKCGTQNPATNQYCAECGAVLAVSTVQMRAQSVSFVPNLKKFRVRYMISTIFVMMGSSFVVLIAMGILIKFSISFDSLTAANTFRTIGQKTPILVIVSALFVLSAFFLSGWLTARMSKSKASIESFVAALVVFAIVGGAFWAVSDDAIIVSLVFAIPCAVVAALGARLGCKGSGKRIET